VNSDHRALLESVGNVIDEQLHDLDPVRVQARIRLQAMLRCCGQLEAHDIGFVPYGRFRGGLR